MHNKLYERYIIPVLSNMDDVALDELNSNNLVSGYLKEIRSPLFVFRNKEIKDAVINRFYWCVLKLYTETDAIKNNSNYIAVRYKDGSGHSKNNRNITAKNIIPNESRLKLHIADTQEKTVHGLIATMSELPMLPADEMLLKFKRLTEITQLCAKKVGTRCY